jgi:hypothetical protein
MRWNQAPLEDLSASLERAARSGARDPRRANEHQHTARQGRAGVAPDNAVSFSDAQNAPMVSKIKGAIQDMPYTMQLPYEIGQKLHSDTQVTASYRDELSATRRQRPPDAVHQIIGYKGEINNPAAYGYAVQAPNGRYFLSSY